jgi:hypothetical protein
MEVLQMKNIVKCVAILVVIGLVAGSAYADQSCRITLSTASKIGNIEFQPGEYKLVVNAPNVRLTELNSSKSVELEARVEDADTKNDQTTIHSRSVDGVRQITEIRIGGSKTRIAFN